MKAIYIVGGVLITGASLDVVVLDDFFSTEVVVDYSDLILQTTAVGEIKLRPRWDWFISDVLIIPESKDVEDIIILLWMIHWRLTEEPP